MKTLIILSAILLTLSSCTKDMPVPDPDPDPVFTPDPAPDPDPTPDPGDDDPGDDDPSCYNNHPGSTVMWMTAVVDYRRPNSQNNPI
jgi:hypothetical protein